MKEFLQYLALFMIVLFGSSLYNFHNDLSARYTVARAREEIEETTLHKKRNSNLLNLQSEELIHQVRQNKGSGLWYLPRMDNKLSIKTGERQYRHPS